MWRVTIVYVAKEVGIYKSENAGPELFDQHTKIFRAKQIGDKLYIYIYAIIDLDSGPSL